MSRCVRGGGRGAGGGVGGKVVVVFREEEEKCRDSVGEVLGFLAAVGSDAAGQSYRFKISCLHGERSVSIYLSIYVGIVLCCWMHVCVCVCLHEDKSTQTLKASSCGTGLIPNDMATSLSLSPPSPSLSPSICHKV